MNHETLDRNLLIVNAVLCLPMGIYFRLRSQATGEPLARREEGLFILIALRLCALVEWLAVLAWMIDPEWMRWASVPLPNWLRGLGAAVALGVVPPLLFWTLRSLGRNLTDTVVTRRAHSLVTSGPYRRVRHPFYVVGFLWIGSLSLITANAFIAVMGLAVVALLVLRTPIEEGKLIERFGDEYRTYMARTPRFCPGLRRAS